jgi:hypothetical protein
MITQPIGAHNDPPFKVNGNSPRIVVNVVITTGMNLTLADSVAATIIDFPSDRKVLAKSTKTIEFNGQGQCRKDDQGLTEGIKLNH